MDEKTCLYCGKEIVNQHPNRKYCKNDICYRAALKKQKLQEKLDTHGEQTCLICKKKYIPRFRTQFSCSSKCSKKAGKSRGADYTVVTETQRSMLDEWLKKGYEKREVARFINWEFVPLQNKLAEYGYKMTETGLVEMRKTL